MDKSRPSFQVRPGKRYGERLILRNPTSSPEIRRVLQLAGAAPVPSNITVGYYRQLDDPPGAWAFMPVLTTAAIALLDMDLVRHRIAEDLIIRLKEQQRDR